VSDSTELAKLFTQDILGSFKRDVADEKSIALRAGRISVRLGAVRGLVLVVTIASRLGSGEIDIRLAIVNQTTLLRFQGSRRIGSIDKFNVAESVTVSVIANMLGARQYACRTLWSGPWLDR
jgi:hypothetical protein